MSDSEPRVAPFVLTNRHKDVIRGDAHHPARPDGSPVLVICHGFKGFKDWGAFPHIAAYFSAQGWTVLRFNFSLNGVGDDPLTFTRLDDFRRNTYTRELEDLIDVLDAVTSGVIDMEGADAERLALLGHSRGGGIAIVATAEDARVRAVASWASVSTFDRWGPQLKATWRERGLLEVMNTRTKQKMPLGVELLEDYERNASRLDICAAASRLAVPLLVVHGEQDMSVPLEEAFAIHLAADRSLASLSVIPNTDHVFGASHPFAGMPDPLARVLAGTEAWLRLSLGMAGV
ncbi:MAG: alpha/beta fold hydrolase [Ignavibacteria bacterium]|nr:alpha/beta fold hydrolase [Ignavibacteria bacterium]